MILKYSKSKSIINSVDCDSQGNILEIDNENNVIFGEKKVKLELDHRVVIIKYINEYSFLVTVTSSYTKDYKDNTFIYNWEGKILNQFDIGGSACQLIVNQSKIIVGYSDQASDILSQNGLNIFDMKGNLLYSYNQNNNFEIVDCYSICTRDNYIYALIYTGKYPISKEIKKINLTDYSLSDVNIEANNYSTIFSCKENNLYLFIKGRKSSNILDTLKVDGTFISRNETILKYPLFINNEHFIDYDSNILRLYKI